MFDPEFIKSILGGIAFVIALGGSLFAWRNKGINDAVGQEKAKSRVKESIDHIEKMEKEKEDAKTVHEIESLVSQLDDNDTAERLRAFRD